MPPSGNEDRDILIITQFSKSSSAFHVHKVDSINHIPLSDIERPDSTIYGGDDGLATGIARYDNRLITIIDFEKILSDISPESGVQISEIDRLGSRALSEKPILIAEDSPLLERMLLASLGKANFSNVTCCANGKEAWDILEGYKNSGRPLEEQVSCVITDVEMPQMDGHKLLKQIRADKALQALPVIIFSSMISDEMRVKGEALGANAQLSKPDVGILVSLIDKYAI
jgi:two-component system chemotaxis response regulator CheV